MPERKPLFYLFKYFVCVKVARWCKWKVSGRKSNTNLLKALPYTFVHSWLWSISIFLLSRGLNGKTARAVRGGADKSLARPTSRCRRTESIVLLEREVCSCAELQVFSCYRGWKEACQATRAVLITWRRGPSSSLLFPSRQGAEGNSRHSDRNIRATWTMVCHRQKPGGPV